MRLALILLLSALARPGIGDALGAEPIRVGWPIAPITFADPFARDEGAGLRWAIYDGLTALDGAGAVKPRLAESWTLETPLRWSLKLRQGVVFANGEIFDASAAKATFDILFDPAAPKPRALDITGIAAVRAKDSAVLEIETVAPDPLLLRKLALLPMVAPRAWRTVGAEAYARAPVGTGPYRIVSWGTANARPLLAMVANPWRRPRAESVQLIAIPDLAARVAALLSDQLDLAIGFGPDDIDVLEAGGIRVAVLPSTNVLALAFRTVGNENAPILDPRIRRALNFAIDRETIAARILAGTSKPASQATTPDAVGFNSDLKPYPYDPDRARALIAEAGYPKGFAMKIAVYGGLLPGDRAMFQRIAQDLGKVGVDATLMPLAFPDYVRRLANGDWAGIDAFSLGALNVLLGDPMHAVEQFSCAAAAPFACDRAAMPLIAAARTEMDPAKRNDLLRRIMTRMDAAGAALWLVEMATIIAARPGIAFTPGRLDGSMLENLARAAP